MTPQFGAIWNYLVGKLATMKKKGIINSKVSEIVANMGHKDELLITDAGFPISSTVKKADLAVRRGLPGFFDVLESILDELEVEKAVVIGGTGEENPEALERLKKSLPDYVEFEYIPLQDFKEKAKSVKGAVRTGEVTPYCNVILVSGVKGIFYP